MQPQDQSQPQAESRHDSQQSSAPQEAGHCTHLQHTEQQQQQPSQSVNPQDQQSLHSPHSQDQFQGFPKSQGHNQDLSDGAVLAPDLPAPPLRAEPNMAVSPVMAPKQGSPPQEVQPSSGALPAQAHPNWNLYSSQQTAVFDSTPVLSGSQPTCLPSSSSDTPKLPTWVGSGSTPSVATAGSADEVPEAELSPMQRALRSLSSKGIQTIRSPSGKDFGEARTPRDGGSFSTGKLSLGPLHGLGPNVASKEAIAGSDCHIQGLGDEGVQEPVSQRAGAVRQMASRLNLRSNSSKHMS